MKGTSTAEIKERAQNAKFDERLSLISLLMSQLDQTISETVALEDALKQTLANIKAMPKVEDSSMMMLIFKRKLITINLNCNKKKRVMLYLALTKPISIMLWI